MGVVLCVVTGAFVVCTAFVCGAGVVDGLDVVVVTIGEVVVDGG